MSLFMGLGTRDVLLGVSLVGNVLLGMVLVIVVVANSGVSGVIPTQKEGEQLDRLVLQMRCGDGDKTACEQSLKLDREACAKGEGHACVLLGITYQVGKKVPKDEAAAVPFFEKGCSLGDGSGCWYAGSCYEMGRGVSKDLGRAIELLRKACDKNEKNGCLSLGDAYRNSTPPDVARALEAYDRGCSLGYDWSCNRAKDLRAKK